MTGATSAAGSTITSLGGGWYRCTLTALFSANVTTVLQQIRSAVGDGSGARIPNATYTVDCAQLEVGAFATSIIPTTSAAVTRAADVAVTAGANFSSWYNQSEGTFVVEASRTVSAGYSGVTYMAHDGSSANRIYQSNGFNVEVGGVLQAGFGYSGLQTGNPIKIADAYAVNNFASCVAGGAVAQDGAGAIPTVNQLRLGSSLSGNTTTLLNGHIRRLTYYAIRLPNAQLQALTT